MRALSIKQPWAELIARGDKTSEYRTWTVGYRGPLLIVASASPDVDACADEGINPRTCARGVAVCTVDLVSIDGDSGDYEWALENPRRVAPTPIVGRVSLYDVPDDRIAPVGAVVPPRFDASRTRSTSGRTPSRIDDAPRASNRLASAPCASCADGSCMMCDDRGRVPVEGPIAIPAERAPTSTPSVQWPPSRAVRSSADPVDLDAVRLLARRGDHGALRVCLAERAASLAHALDVDASMLAAFGADAPRQDLIRWCRSIR